MMMSCLTLLLAAAPANLENGGFEAADVTAGWQRVIYRDGADPVIRADTTTFVEGRQALLIEAQEPADIALAQNLPLPVGSLWRARYRVRTENLVAPGTEVGATIQIETASGARIARGESHFGTNDWRDAEVLFRSPPGGIVHIALFYVGFGRGTGKVWFDDVRLEPVEKETPPNLEIDLSKRGARPIDAKQCGQFIEPLCGMIPSAGAQQVAGDSFEEEPGWRVGFRPEVDKPYRPWYPSGAVHVAHYALDPEKPFNGKRSQKIELPVSYTRAGISQDGFYTKEGVSYRLALHMRGAGRVRVFATLHGGGGMIAGPVELGSPGAEWQKAEAALKAVRTSENCTLTIECEGPGTLWLDRISLIGDDAVAGLWRPDFADALKELHPGVVRFGGSTIEAAFNWQDCIGSWDTRAPYAVPCWGGLEPNFGGPEEVVQLCRYVGAEPLLCIRWTDRTPADAAAQVEYFNGAADTPMGRRRAANGHPEPYGVKYWQVGNEVGGDEYDRSLLAFARAMKAVDPSIKVITAFAKPDLRASAGLVDYLSEHHYGCEDLRGLQAGFEALRAELRGLPDASVRMAITEWNTTAGAWGLGRGSLGTLGNALACSRYHNLIQRYADVVEITNRSNLVDSFCSGIIQTGPGWLYCTPTYYTQQLYARAAGSFALEVRDTSGVPWPLQEPDVSATLSADGHTLRIYAVNSAPQAAEVAFVLRDATSAVQGGTVYVVRDRDAAPTAEVLNTRDDPRRIAVLDLPAAVHGRVFRHEFAPLSVTLLELELAE